jgi:hypothetical protein
MARVTRPGGRIVLHTRRRDPPHRRRGARLELSLRRWCTGRSQGAFLNWDTGRQRLDAGAPRGAAMIASSVKRCR